MANKVCVRRGEREKIVVGVRGRSLGPFGIMTRKGVSGRRKRYEDDIGTAALAL